MEIESTQKQENTTLPEHLHTFQCGGTKFTVDKKYELKRFFGYTSRGPECLVIDKTSSQVLRLRKIENFFHNMYSARETVREICLTRFFDHENIVKIADIMQSETETGSQNIYLVSEHLETDLHRVIYSRQPLYNAHIQFFIYQILRGLFYLHSTGLIHRALSAQILLVSRECDLKIAYLQSVKPSQEKFGVDSEYAINRHYLSPEVLLGYQDTQAIDIWAVGCILAELLGRTMLFPGRDYKHQLQTIFNVLGTPEEDDFGFKLPEETQKYLQSFTKADKIPWSNLFPQADPIALDLLDNMLNINLEKRFTALECLRHPYFEDLYDLDDLPSCQKRFFWDYTDSSEPTRESLQKILDEQIKKIPSSK